MELTTCAELLPRCSETKFVPGSVAVNLEVGNMDDSVINISVNDGISVTFNKHLVLIKHVERLRGLNLHQFVIPPGTIKDISGRAAKSAVSQKATVTAFAKSMEAWIFLV